MKVFYGEIPEWPKGADCKSVSNAFDGSNPSLPILQKGFIHEFNRTLLLFNIAGWSSSEARRAHNPKVAGSNPAPATLGGVTKRPLMKLKQSFNFIS